jgi:CDP-4-dehydro-6-deoxyglucose reductase
MSGSSGGWAGRRGWVHEAVLEDHPDLSGVAVYAAGPPPMIAAIQEAFPAHGLAPDRLYFDSFEFGADRTGG